MIIGFAPAGLLYLDIAFAVYLNSQHYMLSFSPDKIIDREQKQLSKTVALRVARLDSGYF